MFEKQEGLMQARSEHLGSGTKIWSKVLSIEQMVKDFKNLINIFNKFKK